MLFEKHFLHKVAESPADRVRSQLAERDAMIRSSLPPIDMNSPEVQRFARGSQNARKIHNAVQRVSSPLDYGFAEGADRVFQTLQLPGNLLYSGINAIAGKTVIPTSWGRTPATPAKERAMRTMSDVYSPQTAANIVTAINGAYNGAEAALGAKGLWDMSKVAFPVLPKLINNARKPITRGIRVATDKIGHAVRQQYLKRLPIDMSDAGRRRISIVRSFETPPGPFAYMSPDEVWIRKEFAEAGIPYDWKWHLNRFLQKNRLRRLSATSSKLKSVDDVIAATAKPVRVSTPQGRFPVNQDLLAWLKNQSPEEANKILAELSKLEVDPKKFKVAGVTGELFSQKNGRGALDYKKLYSMLFDMSEDSYLRSTGRAGGGVAFNKARGPFFAGVGERGVDLWGPNRTMAILDGSQMQSKGGRPIITLDRDKLYDYFGVGMPTREKRSYFWRYPANRSQRLLSLTGMIEDPSRQGGVNYYASHGRWLKRPSMVADYGEVVRQPTEGYPDLHDLLIPFTDVGDSFLHLVQKGKGSRIRNVPYLQNK